MVLRNFVRLKSFVKRKKPRNLLSPPKMTKVVAGSGYEYGFFKYLPEGFTDFPTKKWPVLIFMHGTGARGLGTSQDLDLLLTDAAPTLPSEIGFDGVDSPKVDSAWRSGGSNPYKDMIVLIPQTDGTMDRGPLGRFMQDILADANMRIDPDRVFLTGFSLGFIGAARYLINTELDYNRVAGDRPPIAGAYIIAGSNWQSAYAGLTVDRGIDVMSWAGELDATYRANSEAIITDINAVRSNYVPPFTEIPGEGHNANVWGPQYQDYTSAGMYARLLNKPLRIVPSKSTGGNWPVMGFTGSVILPADVDLLTDDIKVMLVNSNHTPANDTFINTVNVNEISGTGYTTGGASLTGKTLVSNDFDADDVVWTDSQFNDVRYIYLYKNTGTPSTSPIISYIDLSRSRNTAGVDFVIQWYSTGILTVFAMEATNVVTQQSSGIVTGSIFVSYDYSNNLGYLENNAPPELEGVIISGSATTGSVLTAIPEGYFSRSGYPSGSHIYKWYSAADKQGTTQTLLQNSTSSTYIPQNSDISKFIRVGVIPVQIGGLNTTGSEVSSMYVGEIQGPPPPDIVNLNWDAAFVQSDLVAYSSSGVWIDRGTTGNYDATVDTPNPLPIYSAVSSSLLFNKDSGSNLRFGKPATTMTQPYEYWIRFKPVTTAAQQFPIGLSNSFYIRVETDNTLTVNGFAVTSSISVTDNEWSVFRIYTSGSNSIIQMNSGSETPFSSSTATIGNDVGRLGSPFTTGSIPSTYFNGYISDVMLKDTPLSGSQITDVWNYFGF